MELMVQGSRFKVYGSLLMVDGYTQEAIVKADPKNIITWVLILIVPVVAVVAVTGLLNYMEPGLMKEIVKDHFAAVVGLPMSALLSAFIVVGLRHTEGSIKFEGLGMKFEGASGQVILWVICFLSIAAAIKLLW